LPVAAAALYAGISQYPWKEGPQAAATGTSPHEGAGDAGSLEQATAALQQRLKDNPADLEGWRMLGRSYLVTGKVDEAIAAYEKADGIAGGTNPDLSLDLAEALILSERPDVQERARAIIAATLEADGKSQKALWYSGVLAMRDGEQETAKARFTTLLALDPPPEIRDIINQQLASLGVEAAPAASPATAPAAAPAAGQAVAPTGRTIRVSVSLDPALQGRLKPGVPVFVSARQPGIPGPPLAAVRLMSDELPAMVVLSDANSMIEGRNLSSVEDVEVVARVAFGGSAATATGDLLGDAVHKKGTSEELAVAISRVQP
jgi:cytochrome c-type biogenesis protein CcmH